MMCRRVEIRRLQAHLFLSDTIYAVWEKLFNLSEPTFSYLYHEFFRLCGMEVKVGSVSESPLPLITSLVRSCFE